MSTVNLLARNCTLFTTTKALDEDAYRESLQRFVDFRIGFRPVSSNYPLTSNHGSILLGSL